MKDTFVGTVKPPSALFVLVDLQVFMSKIAINNTKERKKGTGKKTCRVCEVSRRIVTRIVAEA